MAEICSKLIASGYIEKDIELLSRHDASRLPEESKNLSSFNCMVHPYTLAFSKNLKRLKVVETQKIFSGEWRPEV